MTQRSRTAGGRRVSSSARLSLPPIAPAQAQEADETAKADQAKALADQRALFDDAAEGSGGLPAAMVPVSADDVAAFPRVTTFDTLASGGPYTETLQREPVLDVDGTRMIVCGNCGRSWEFSRRMAGSIVPCMCGQEIAVPTATQVMDGDATFFGTEFIAGRREQSTDHDDSGE